MARQSQKLGACSFKQPHLFGEIWYLRQNLCHVHVLHRSTVGSIQVSYQRIMVTILWCYQKNVWPMLVFILWESYLTEYHWSRYQIYGSISFHWSFHKTVVSVVFTTQTCDNYRLSLPAELTWHAWELQTLPTYSERKPSDANCLIFNSHKKYANPINFYINK